MARAIRFLLAAAAALTVAAAMARAEDAASREGAAAYGDWRADAPGIRRRIDPATLPPPFATRAAANVSRVVARPPNFAPKAPPGFEVSVFAEGLANPRVIRTAPNGDVFVAESGAGRLRVFAPGAPAAVSTGSVFAAGLDGPFGIAFYPPGSTPQFVYVATTTRVLRFPYRDGDRVARAPPETVVDGLPAGGHWTRDLAVARDGGTVYVSVGSRSNDAEAMPRLEASAIRDLEAKSAPGAAWGAERNRAAVLALDPDGGHPRLFATGLRNCAGLAIQPQSGALWCAVNERDGLGDDLPPDYATRVTAGGFYGWPWFYIGAHEDPLHKGERPDLEALVVTPDALIQPHSAPLGLAFYDAAAFPPAYRGDAFVALHGSWNRAKRTGYKVVRLLMRDGAPTGVYEDFVTGFVADDASVYGRPVAVAVAADGALLVTDDGAGVIWRVAYRGD